MKNITSQPYKARNEKEKYLAEAFTKLKTEQDVLNFLRDLLTPSELEEFANRLQIAKLLMQEKMSYTEIAKKISVSTTTVTRVAQWVFSGCGGYAKVLN